MRVCVPVTPAGQIDRWGRARQVALAQVVSGEIADWQLSNVGWDQLHESGTEGAHHARIARFVREQGVEAVVAVHMGEGMAHMLHRLGVTVHVGAGGDARTAVLRAARGELEATQG